ncbi:TetR/AcrR family transcriptional regulator [Blastococcus sp. URHD0036]|uniref:TetR/AcrR family transcriptional regulator n=1 Tax=Blastococcus sp. URHD0036 TaxID=1380356 RepID=UPI0018CC071A|nr:TetR/AcrR family transcriptional regulator [Blastococcus sp. URHD0036]
MTRTTGQLRSELVRAGAVLLERTGAEEAVTLRAVAREAGVSAPAVYGHFADLTALLDAVVAEGFDELRARILAAVEPLADPVDRLVAGCRAYVEAGLVAPVRYRAMFGGRRGSGGEAFAVLVDGVSACVTAGRSGSEDPAADAALLWTALHGVVTLRVTGADPSWPDQDTLVRTLVGRLARIRGDDPA